MPGKLSPAEEKDWKKSKKNVRDYKDKPQGKFKDQDWALVQHIYQLRRKKHTKGKKKKKAYNQMNLNKIAINIMVEPFEPLVQKAIDLVEQKTPGILTNLGVKKVVVESGAGNHFGKVESDKMDTIFVAVDKIKAAMNGGKDEQAVIQEIALTLAHEAGHLKDKLKNGEGPALTEEKQMEQKLSNLSQDSLAVTAADEQESAQATFAGLEKRMKQLNMRISAMETLLGELLEDQERRKREKKFANKSTGELSSLLDSIKGELANRGKTQQVRQFPEYSDEDLKTLVAGLKNEIDARKIRFPNLTDERLATEIKNREAKLNAIFDELSTLQAQYSDLTGQQFAAEKPTATMPEDRANKPADPAAPAAGPTLPEVEEDVTEDEFDNYSKMIGRVEMIAMRRLNKGTGAGLRAAVPANKHQVATNVVIYMLGKGSGELLVPGTSYMGMIGEKGDAAIKKELEKKKQILETYKEQLAQDHAEQKHLSINKEELLDPATLKFMNEELDQMKKRNADPATIAAMEKEVDLGNRIHHLRDKLKNERQIMADHIEYSAKLIVSRVGLIGTSDERVGHKPEDLSPESQKAMEKALEKSRGLGTPDNRPMHQQIPAPHFTGYQQDAPRWSTTPGVMKGTTDKPVQLEQQLDEDDQGSRRSRINVVRPGSGKKGPIMEGDGVSVIRRKKSDEEIPLAKQAANPKHPSELKPYERKMLDKMKIPTSTIVEAVKATLTKEEKALLQKLKQKQPLAPIDHEILKSIKAKIEAHSHKFRHETGGTRPFFAPTDEEKAMVPEEWKQPVRRSFEDFDQMLSQWAKDMEEHVAKGPDAQVGTEETANRLEWLYKYMAYWKADLKSMSRKRVAGRGTPYINEAQRAAAKKKIEDLKSEIKKLESLIQMSQNFTQRRNTGIPPRLIPPVKPESSKAKQPAGSSKPWTSGDLAKLKNELK